MILTPDVCVHSKASFIIQQPIAILYGKTDQLVTGHNSQNWYVISKKRLPVECVTQINIIVLCIVSLVF